MNALIDDYPIEEIERTVRRAWILSYAKKSCICAEFGVFRGHFSEVIARETSPSRLFLVDPWRKGAPVFDWGQHPYVLRLTRNNTLTTQEALDETKLRMRQFSCAEYVEETLETFCLNFPAYSSALLDFAYLDTSHTYVDTLSQLALIAAVLAPDGMIFGDDWQPEITHPHHGVFRAVNEFVKAADFQFVAAGPEQQFCIRRSAAYR